MSESMLPTELEDSTLSFFFKGTFKAYFVVFLSNAGAEYPIPESHTTAWDTLVFERETSLVEVVELHKRVISRQKLLSNIKEAIHANQPFLNRLVSCSDFNCLLLPIMCSDLNFTSQLTVEWKLSRA